MIRFIGHFKDCLEVEPDCVAIAVTKCGFIPSLVSRAVETRTSWASSVRDDLLIGEITRIHAATYLFYWVSKMHAVMHWTGCGIVYAQVPRLIRKAGLRGAIRGPKSITTKPAARSAGLFPDLV